MRFVPHRILLRRLGTLEYPPYYPLENVVCPCFPCFPLLLVFR
jgi:hypothetical protein